MEPFVYLLKASLVLGVCYGAYWLLFRRDTFHQTKRLVLLTGLGLSVGLPLLRLTAWQMPISVEPTRAAAIPLEYWLFLQQTQPVENSMFLEAGTCLLLYGIVCGAMGLGLIIRLFKLFRFLQSTHYPIIDGCRVAVHPQVQTPFSFFHWMVLPENLSNDTLRSQVVAHEAAHIRQWHTLDILLMELYLVFFWFNPVAWLYRRQLRLNLEHLADAAVLQSAEDAYSYQMNLMKISSLPNQFSLANHFHFSSLKNRIRMMNRPNSPLQARLKYIVLPLAAAGLVSLFHLTQAQTLPASVASLVINSDERLPSRTGVIEGWVFGDKIPLAGVFVSLKGKSTETVTNAEGKFSLPAEAAAEVLQLNHVGYEPIEVNVKLGANHQANVGVLMQPATEQSARRQTSGVTTDQDATPLKDPLYIVNGQKRFRGNLTKEYLAPYEMVFTEVIRGADAIDRYGEEGKNGVVVVQTRAPLYTVDGKEISTKEMQKIDPNTIERIDVLKDKAATDKYGDKGRNGVVLIVLKKK